MNSYTLTVLLTIAITATGFPQPILQWDSRFHGPIANDQGNAIAVDANGNVYVTGSSDGNAGAKDYLTIKYNADGDTLWSRRYNGDANGEDVAVAIKVDASGNVYITGKSPGNTTGDDIVTIKYDSSGIQQWAEVFDGGNTGTNKHDVAYDLIVDVFGNVYVVGSSYYQSESNRTNGVVIKYNSSGIRLWHINIDEDSQTSADEVANLVAINHFGNVVVAEGIYNNNRGYFRILELNPLDGNVVRKYNTNQVSSVPGFPNALILDGIGNMYITCDFYSFNNTQVRTAKFTYGIERASWFSVTFLSVSGTISGVDIKIDANLNVYVVSDFYNGINHTYHIKKNSPSGSTQWSKQYNATAGIDDIPVSIALNNLGNPDIFVTGYTGTGNITTVKFDNDGNQLWFPPPVYDCGNNGIDIASAMVMDDCENIYITGYSNCDGTSEDVKTIKYSTLAPPQPGAITGDPTVCSGTSQTYSIAPVPGATSYTWTLPSGWSGESLTNNITARGSTTSGVITVIANNACGSSSAQTLAVTVDNAPVTPGAITGDPTVCSGASQTYSIAPVPGATSYTWTLPSGWSGESLTNSITARGSTSGVITVIANNACGSSSAQILAVTVDNAPVTPGIITGDPTVCSGASQTYSTATVPGATSYTWTLPSGWSGESLTNSITANGSTSGTITVTANNTCGSSSAQTLTVTVNSIPTTPGAISGNPTVCSGLSQTYSVTPVPGAESYTWTLPFGWSAPDTTNNITVVAGSGGNISVTANNACGSSSAQTLAITVDNSAPSDPFASASPNPACIGDTVNLGGGATGATSWSWNGPNGFSSTSQHLSLTNIQLDQAGSYAVTATNSCGNSSASVNLMVNNVDTSVTQDLPTLIANASTASYQWLDCNNGMQPISSATNQSYTATQTGSYAVQVTQNGCTATTRCYPITVTGIDEFTSISNLIIYPNPNSGRFTVSLESDEARSVEILCKNLLGQSIFSKEYNLTNGELNIELDLSTVGTGGLYLVQIRNHGKSVFRKVFVSE